MDLRPKYGKQSGTGQIGTCPSVFTPRGKAYCYHNVCLYVRPSVQLFVTHWRTYALRSYIETLRIYWSLVSRCGYWIQQIHLFILLPWGAVALIRSSDRPSFFSWQRWKNGSACGYMQHYVKGEDSKANPWACVWWVGIDSSFKVCIYNISSNEWESVHYKYVCPGILSITVKDQSNHKCVI